MKYKSKYTVILMVEDKKIVEKEIELANIVTNRNEIVSNIEKEEEKSALFRSYLSNNQTIDSSYLSGSLDHHSIDKWKKELDRLDIELKIKRYEYQNLKEKRKVIEELDRKEEKEFYNEQRKKEQKKLIALKTIEKAKEHGGD